MAEKAKRKTTVKKTTKKPVAKKPVAKKSSTNSNGWKFSISESLSYGWEKTKKFFWITLGLAVLMYIVNFAMQFVYARAVFANGLLGFVIWLFSMYVSFMISLGWMKTMLKVLSGKAPALAYFLDAENHKYFWSYVGTNLLYAFIVICGCILLIVPGIVWAYTYVLAPVLVADKNMNPFDALATSRKLVAGQRWNMFIFYLALVGLNIVGAICLGIGLFITVPISYYASVHVYGKLAGKAIK